MDTKRPIRDPMPDNAKRVFQGVIFDVYQWEQEMFDGSKAVFEKLKRPDTAVIIASTSDKEFIILEEEQPNKRKFSSIPGGRFDEGEDPLTAAKRELVEETGYESDDWTLFFVDQPVGKIDWLIYFFVAKNCVKKSEAHLDVGERIDLKLCSFDEFLDFITAPGFVETALKIRAIEAKAGSQKLIEFKKTLGA